MNSLVQGDLPIHHLLPKYVKGLWKSLTLKHLPYPRYLAVVKLTMLKPSDDYVLTIRQAPERAKVAGTKEKGIMTVGAEHGQHTLMQPIRPQTRRSSANHPVADKRCHRSGSVRLYILYQLPWAVLGWLRLSNYLQSPYYFMCCNLSDLNQDPRNPIGNPQLSNSQQQVLAGTLVSSLHRLKDVDNTGGSNIWVHVSSRDAEVLTADGGFFVFGDVSVKIEGEYRLRFSLFEMVRERHEVMYIKSVISEPFTGEPKVWSVIQEACWLRSALQSIHLGASREWMSLHSCHDPLETREFGWESGKNHERCCEYS